ncbi:Zinc finger PHD-type [Arabidopsis thaliana x Arabidopsis arenosa]|uniref:Zinc finger PHD-type n=1 Tax=Arabidopsis thaliana x Arabidopsis arenosa TaxID=1240361 RepID=A0A8T2GMI0_9BRAS|nr:Zinc finger PHD-type [Arabidopsis thaliana x Arabidopsis arenosa]
MDPLKIENAANITVCRLRHDFDQKEDFRSEHFKDSPVLVLYPLDERKLLRSTHTSSSHPLVWCNNGENKDKYCKRESRCRVCSYLLDDDIGYYFLREDLGQNERIFFHKECIEPITNNPYHRKHPLQVLVSDYLKLITICYCCCRRKELNFYCSICNFCICAYCEAKPPLLTIDHKKRHEHTLSYFPREASITCNVCALDERRYFLYICHQCDFVVHKECIYSPCIVKISRHQHRLSFASSFLPRKWFCGVCRKKVDENYGGYSCVKGCYYVSHSRCALRKDVWDGKELEEEPDEIYKDLLPFKEIAGGIIQHFSHKHQMRLHKYIDKKIEDNKHCQACALPVYNCDIFSCMECEFILHTVCANLSLQKEHVIHPHALFLQVGHMFSCSACQRQSNSFTYMCQMTNCNFRLDVICASTSEPLNHHFHPHLLFLPSDFGSTRICSICKVRSQTRFDCGKCDFVLCFYCATIPMKFRYKHDEHLLTFSYEQDASSEHWCDVCERKIYLKNGIYMCSECDITLHIQCLLGKEMYMLPGKEMIIYGGEEKDILRSNRLTRYICKKCNKRCQNGIVYKNSDETICCSMECLYQMFSSYIFKKRSITL